MVETSSPIRTIARLMLGDPIVRQTRRAGAIQLGPFRDWSQYEIDLPLADLPPALDGLRILHLSDTHFTRRWSDGFDRLLGEVEQLNADVIAFTGDWLEDKFDYRIGLENALRFARGLRAKFGVFAILGNHDGDLLAPRLVDAGVTLLVGESRRIVGGDASIEIIGLPGVARDDTSKTMIDAFGEPIPGSVRIVLSHFPDSIQRIAAPMRPHVVLAGHTHGGQCCLPGGKPIITHDSLDPSYSAGLHRLHDTWLHVSRGLGCSGIAVRVFAPPEISVIRLVSGAAR